MGGENRGLTSPPINPELDLAWSKMSTIKERTPHTYFDYVFTGQDVKVYIEGMEGINEGCIPIIEFAFSVEQQKVPVYGFWSYAFDNVMRGTRLVSGQVRIATESTQYMVNKVAEAAASRVAKKEGLNPVRGMDKDEENIDKYWTRNLDPEIAFNNDQHLFSAHPPFNLVCNFHMQSVSVGDSPLTLANSLWEEYQEMPAAFQGYNERLVPTEGESGTMCYILENVELTGMSTEFSPTGEVISEVYTFFAREIRTPKK